MTWQHLPAEFRHMLEKDMTVHQAIDYHCNEVWRFSQPFAMTHELAHLLIGLSSLSDYQGSAQSEALTIITQPFLDRLLDASTKRELREELKEDGMRKITPIMRPQLLQNNHDRTLLWLLGKQTGETSQEIKKRLNFDSEKLLNEAASRGISSVWTKHAAKWQITDPDGVIYNYNTQDSNAQNLPKGSNGVEIFTPSRIPTRNEVSRLKNALTHCLGYLSDRVLNAGPPKSFERYVGLEETKLREIYSRIPPLRTAGRAVTLNSVNATQERQRG